MKKKPPAYHDDLKEDYVPNMNEYLLPFVAKSPGLLDKLSASRRHSFIKEAAERWLRQAAGAKRRTKNLQASSLDFPRRVFDGWHNAVGHEMPQRDRFQAARRHLDEWGVDPDQVSDRTLFKWLKEYRDLAARSKG